ncbi:hypothetical protein D3C85_884010 [compost metagenome]
MNANLLGIARQGAAFQSAKTFELLIEQAVVYWLAAIGVLFQQGRDDHARALVIRNQISEEPRTPDVRTQLCDGLSRTVVGVRHHRPPAKPLFCHFGPAHRWHPDGFHERPIDARREEKLVIDLLQYHQVLRVIDIALGVFNDNAQVVAESAQIRFVLQVVADERVGLWDQVLEASIHHQLAGLQGEDDGQYCADEHDRQSIVEQQPLQSIARA